MRTLGIQFEERQLAELKSIQQRDRRSIGLMVREAVDDYIAKRKAEIERKRQATEKALADTEAMLVGMSEAQRKKVIDAVRERFVDEAYSAEDATISKKKETTP